MLKKLKYYVIMCLSVVSIIIVISFDNQFRLSKDINTNLFSNPFLYLGVLKVILFIIISFCLSTLIKVSDLMKKTTLSLCIALLLVGCSNKIKTNDLIDISNSNTENTNFFPQTSLFPNKDSFWLQTRVSDGVYSNNKVKRLYIFHPINENTLTFEQYIVDPSNCIFNDNVTIDEGMSNTGNVESINSNDNTFNLVFNQIDGTPFYNVDESKSGKYPTYLSMINARTQETGKLLKETGSLNRVEDQFIHKYTFLHFKSKNDDLRKITISTLMEYVLFDIPTFDSKSKDSKIDEANFIAQELFSNSKIDQYMKERYDLDIPNMYYSIDNFKLFLYDNKERIFELINMSDEDYFWLVNRSLTPVTYHQDWEYSSKDSLKKLESSDRVRQTIDFFEERKRR